MNTELQKRVATGLIGGAALMGFLIFGGWIAVFLLVTLMSLGLIYEYSTIAFSLPDQTEKKYLLLFLTWLIAFMNLIFSQNEFHLLLIVFLSLFTYFLITAKRHEGPFLSDHFKELSFALFGLVYLVFFPLFFRKIYEIPNSGLEWTLLFLFMNWAGDSGAYFAGKKYGTRKLYPQISPKKTREGAWGGLAASLVITLLFKLTFFRVLPWFSAFLIPLVVGVVSQTGDLCESFFKRAFDKKDSGSILPGHGGVLDRFDGVVFSLPVMYACIRLFT